ncbi:MAG: uncharacterized protein A8A55_3112, partial [Amphiamblys sp. WSBS2006]
MGTGMAETLKLGNTFFVFTDRNLFLAPEREYKRIQLREKKYVFLEKRNIPGMIDFGVRRITCIICQEEPSPGDIVSPMCRDVHYVLCRECAKEDETVMECPFCKENERDNNAFQQELIDVVFSRMPH